MATDSAGAEEFIDLRIRLKGEMLKRFKFLKERMGFETDTETMRWLITTEYDRMQGR